MIDEPLVDELPGMADLARLPVETREAVAALTRSAALFRRAFIAAADGKPPGRILPDSGPYLELADRVIDAWASSLGIRLEEEG